MHAKIISIFRKVAYLVLKEWYRFVRPQMRLPKHAKIGRNTFFGKGRKIIIGEHFFCGRLCHISAPAKIGCDVMLASNVALVGGDHQIDQIRGPIRLSGRDEFREINIEDDVWVGHGSIILHGVRLGKGCVIAAGSVVTKNVPPMAIYGGNPAKLIRYRY